jgi:hypothetical protein
MKPVVPLLLSISPLLPVDKVDKEREIIFQERWRHCRHAYTCGGRGHGEARAICRQKEQSLSQLTPA